MKKCQQCDVQVNTHTDFCPLCNEPLIVISEFDTPPLYPVISEQKKKPGKLTFLAKVFLLVSIFTTATCLIVNLTVWRGVFWSLPVAGGIIVLWLLVGLPLRGGINLNYMLIAQMVGVQLYLLLIDSLFGAKGWAITYVNPFLYIAVAITISLFVVLYRVEWQNYLFTLVLMAAIGVCSFLNILFQWGRVPWPNMLAALTDVMIVFGLLIFAPDKLKKEIRKRLHL